MTQITITELLQKGNKLAEQLAQLRNHREQVMSIAARTTTFETEDSEMCGLNIQINRSGYHTMSLDTAYLPMLRKEFIAGYIGRLDVKIAWVKQELVQLIPAPPVPPAEVPQPKKGRPKKKK